AKRRAYTLADNKLALNATWDDELLRVELTELSFDETLNFDAFGFSQSELDKILSSAQPTTDEEIDDVNPQVPRQPVSQPGDIWDMGEHKLICGDSTDPAVVARVLNGSRPTLLFTSPPYGQQRDYTVGIDDWTSLMEGVFGASLPVMADAGQVLVNLGLIHRDGEWVQYWTGWMEWMRSAGWKKFGLYVWDQGPGLPGDWGGRLAPAFEFVFHFNRSSRKPNKIVEAKNAGQLLAGTGLRGADGKLHKKTGHGKPIQDMKIPDSVIRIMRHHGKIEAGAHPAVMAVKLPRFVIETFTDLGETILEPFCGSGSTILAGEQTGRVVRAVELAPEYVDVAVMRWNTVFPDMPATMRGKTLGALARERGCADDVGGRGK
nr:DNA modification methylase [Vicinamibacteria bacterium]